MSPIVLRRREFASLALSATLPLAATSALAQAAKRGGTLVIGLPSWNTASLRRFSVKLLPSSDSSHFSAR